MDWHPFTEEEKSELLRSWKVIEAQKQAVGCDIYEMIFNQVQSITEFV
uniref:BH4_AAA_HYDROXYL_2 domain-containing protein n=1 Tax=Angiostrongylus cantonensis TaxID=6313 RepID=A0A0K0DMH8_ANGCA